MAGATLVVAAVIGTGFWGIPRADGTSKTVSASGPLGTTAPVVSVTAKSAPVSRGGYLDLVANAKDFAGAPLAGGHVNLQRQDNSGWVTVGSTNLSPAGSGGFHFKVWKAHTFRATVAASAAAAPAVDVAVSTPVPVKTTFDDVTFGKAVVAQAAKHKGAPYVWGTDGPGTFDCSGLVKYVFARYGIELPHHANDMKHYGKEISRSEARPGDLVFVFNGSFAHHVAIYAGAGSWWEAPHAGAFVQHVKLRGAHLEFRRIVPSSHGVSW